MLEKLLQICREANPAIPDNPEAKLIDEGYVDSFGAFMILTSIEMDFGITIPESEIKYDNLKSINSMIELINRLLLDDSEQKTSFQSRVKGKSCKCTKVHLKHIEMSKDFIIMGITLWNFPQMHMLLRMTNGKTENIAYFIILIAITAKIPQ